MRRCTLLFYALSLLMMFASRAPLGAERIFEKIQLNGFLSQGYLYSTHNDFLPQSSDSGSYEFSEFALTFSSDLSDKLRLGFQLLSRDFGPIGNHVVKLDWGFADYRFSRGFGLRVGKIKTPMGFYNEIRDTDALFPMVVLPQSIYDESMRPVFVAYDGIGIYGIIPVGVGRLDYHLFTGGVNHPADAPYLSQIRNAVNRSLAPTGMSISPLEMDNQLYYGGRLIWNTPLEGLRFGASMINLRARFNGQMSIPMMGSVDVDGSMKIKNCFFLSAELNIGGLTLSSEYMELPVELTMNMMSQTVPLSDETMQSWYIMGSYLFGDKLTLYLYYDRFYSDKGDSEGNSAAKAGLERFFGWQKDWVTGIRYDVSFNWTVKAECHFIDGVAKSAVFFPDFLHARQKWFMVAGKISYNF